MKLLGTITRVQIQRDPLKIGDRPNRHYTADPLMVVDNLELTPSGIQGMMFDGTKFIDAHNAQHPKSRNRDNLNGISFNFTSHYTHIREKFGSHMVDGCAGENILIQNDGIVNLEDLGTQLCIQSSTGAATYLEALMVAAPCAEFSCYTAQETIGGEQLKHTLQFLDNGIRGFYATLSANQGTPVIQPGDKVFTV